MSENTIDLDFGHHGPETAGFGEKLPVVLLALDQGKYDMARSLTSCGRWLTPTAWRPAEVTQKRSTPKPPPCWGGQGGRSAACLPKFERCGSYF